MSALVAIRCSRCAKVAGYCNCYRCRGAAVTAIRRIDRRWPMTGVESWGPLHLGQRVTADVPGRGRATGEIVELQPSRGRGLVIIRPDVEPGSLDGLVSAVPWHVTIE
jgi:hypothetical protein